MFRQKNNCKIREQTIKEHSTRGQKIPEVLRAKERLREIIEQII
jgi:hypothetical protein